MFLSLCGVSARLWQNHGAEYLPWVCEALDLAKGGGLTLPVVYNTGGYETVVYLEEEPNHIGVNLTEQTIYDPYRAASFLKESGVGELTLELERTHDCFIACQVVWPCNDPATPVISLRLDYTDYESSPLPDERQIKELLAPVVLNCIIQVEEIFPLNKAIIKYYHPDFNPDEHGMTWRTMGISLDHDVPRTKELLDTAELTDG